MRILLTGGFFGSGKTTVVSALTARLLEQGRRVCIVENEIGQFGIDQKLLERAEVNVSTITGGCVCCQVSGGLIAALRQLESDFQPDWVIVELTGAAFADAVVDNLRQYLPGGHPLTVLAVVDSARWTVLSKTARPMLLRQLRGADVIAVTKVDLAREPRAAEEALRELMPRCAVLPLVATRDSCQGLLSLLEERAAGI